MFTAARPSPVSRTPRGPVMHMDPPYPNHQSRAASFFGGMVLIVLLISALVAVDALSGDTRALTRLEIAQMTTYCRDHHMVPVSYTNGSDTKIRAVQCEKPE